MQMYAGFRVTVAYKQNLKSESVEVNRSEWISFFFFQMLFGECIFFWEYQECEFCI